MRIIYFDISSHGQDSVNQLIKHLPERLVKRNNKFHRVQDRLRNLIGLLLFRNLYKLEFGDNPNLELLNSTKLGRPYMPGHTFDFNISHSGKFVVCVLSPANKVGIDIEACKKVPLEDFQNTMNDVQWGTIHRSADPFTTFFKYWCMKESVIKADGRGLSIPLTELVIDQDQVEYDNNHWFLKSFELPDDHVGCLASSSLIHTAELESVKFEDFLN